MKEIDFLPNWYRKNRRQMTGYKWQYAAIVVCFSFMVCWSFISGRIVSSSSAVDTFGQQSVSDTMLEYEKYKAQLKGLNSSKKLIENCKPRIVVSHVLAELSHIIDSSVILSSVEITEQKYSKSETSKTGSVIRSNNKSKQKSYNNDVIYKLVIKGVSSDNNSAAQLICDLEDSSYFKKVILGYSKNVNRDRQQLTEFEISCYLANFKETKSLTGN